jgi:hypothetical protein
MTDNKKAKPENLPPSKEPPVTDPEKIKEEEEKLYKQSSKNGPNPAGNKDVEPDDQEAG